MLHLLMSVTSPQLLGHRLSSFTPTKRPAQPNSLDARQWTRLARDLRRFGHAQHLWGGALLAELLRQRIDRCQVAHF